MLRARESVQFCLKYEKPWLEKITRPNGKMRMFVNNLFFRHRGKTRNFWNWNPAKSMFQRCLTSLRNAWQSVATKPATKACSSAFPRLVSKQLFWLIHWMSYLSDLIYWTWEFEAAALWVERAFAILWPKLIPSYIRPIVKTRPLPIVSSNGPSNTYLPHTRRTKPPLDPEATGIPSPI